MAEQVEMQTRTINTLESHDTSSLCCHPFFPPTLACPVVTGKIPSANSASNFHDAEESYSSEVP